MPSSSVRVARIMLGWDVDAAGEKKVIDSSRRVEQSLSRVTAPPQGRKHTSQILGEELDKLARNRALKDVAGDFDRAYKAGANLETISRVTTLRLAALGATDKEIASVAQQMARAVEETDRLAASAANAKAQITSIPSAPPGALTRRLTLAQSEEDPAGDLGSLRQSIGGGTRNRFSGANLSRIGSELRMLPSIRIPGLGIGTDAAANLIRVGGAASTVMEKTGTSLLTVGKAAGIAGLGLTATILALKAFDSEMEQFRRGIATSVQSLSDIIQALLNDTTREARERLAKIQREQAARTTEMQTLRAALGDAFIDPGETFLERMVRPTTLRQEFALFASNQAGGGQIQERFNQLAAESEKAEKDIANLTAQLELGGFAVNDFTAFMEEFNATFNPEPPSLVEQAVGFRELGERIITSFAEGLLAGARERLEARREAVFAQAEEAGGNRTENLRYAQMSVEQLKATADDLGGATLAAADAMDVIVRSGDQSEEAKDKIQQYGDVIRQNGDDVNRILTIFLPLARAREAEEAAIRSTIDALNERVALEMQAFDLLHSGTVEGIDQQIAARRVEQEALSRTIPELQALAGTSDEARKAFEQAQARIGAINDELKLLTTLRPDVAARQFREASEEMGRQLEADVLNIERARDQRIAQIRAELPDKEAKIVADGNDQLLKLAERHNVDEVKARRDLQRELAKIDSDIANATAERDAVAAFKLEQQKGQEEDAADDREQERDEAYERELRDLAQNIDKRLRAERDGAQKAIDQEYAKARAEVDLKRQAASAELEGLRSSLFAQYGLNNQYWNAAIALAARAVSAISQQQVQPPRQIIVPDYTYSYANGGSSGSVTGSGIQPIRYTRAGGGRLYPYADTLVGEFGPEVVRIPTEGHVYTMSQYRELTRLPAQESLPMAAGYGSGAGGPMSVSLRIDGPALASLMDGRAVRIVGQVLDR
jgi:ketosteroid isomerase-like protein